MGFAAAFKNRLMVRVAIVVPLMGVMFTYFGAKDTISLAQPRRDFNDLSISEIKDGAFYEGEINTCLGNYATEESESSTTYFYLVPMGDIENEKFITVATHNNAYIDILDRLSEDTFVEERSPFIWKCRASKMDKEVQNILNEILIDDTDLYSSTAEVSQHVAPYVLYYHTGSGASTMLVIGIICLIISGIGAFIFIKNRRGSFNTVPPIPQNFYNSNVPSAFNGSNTQSNNFSAPTQSSNTSATSNVSTASVSSMSVNGGMDTISTPKSTAAPAEKHDEMLGMGIMDEIDTSHLSNDD